MTLPPSQLPKILQFETRRLELERRIAYDQAVIAARATRRIERSSPILARLRTRLARTTAEAA